MSKKDGGPAFPLENPRMMENGELFKQFPGMTLRDWFAGQALVGMGQWMPAFRPNAETIDAVGNLSNPHMMRARAEWAYAQADAMLAERDRT